jgi:hypothetical protein
MSGTSISSRENALDICGMSAFSTSTLRSAPIHLAAATALAASASEFASG